MNKPETSYVFDPNWAEALRRYIRSEKAKSGLTYDDISEKLNAVYGINQSPANLKSKITRANFGAQLFLQIMLVMDNQKIDLLALHDLYLSIAKHKSE